MSIILTICILHFFAQLTPGPDVLLIAKCAASTTRINTLKVILGISVGIVIWVLLTLLGFSVLLQQFPWFQLLLMTVGGLFLFKMGYAMFRGGLQTLNQDFDLNVDERNIEKPKNYFLMGFFTNLSNPKTLIYFGSVFSLVLSSGLNTTLTTLLAVVIPLQTFLVFALFMFIMSLPKIKALYQRSGSYIDIFSGVLFIIFAVWLWYDALTML